jgi:putative ABC transport system permease protein
VRGVAGHYTAALGARLVQGRELRPSDNATSQPVVVVTRDFATTYISAVSPIGMRLKMGGPESEGPWRTIVGVVETIHHQALDEAPRPEVWMPFSQVPDDFLTTWARGVYAVTRTSGDPDAAVPAIRTSMRSLDADLPLVALTSLDELTRQSTSARRLETSLLAAFAAIALILAAVGVFGVLAFYVVQHLPEFGVRLALGASPAALVAQVLRRGLILMALGTAIGLPAALALGRTMSTLLFHVAPTDPWAIGVSVAVLTVVTVAACKLPARRAMRTDPLLVLRAD